LHRGRGGVPRGRTSISKVATPVIVGILIYTSLGSLFTIRGLVIYDNLPQGEFIIEGRDFKFTVKNNAPFSFPFVNLPIMVGLEISNTSVPVECMIWTAKGYVSSKEAVLDLGYIPVGKSEEVTFTLKPRRTSFTITARCYADILGLRIMSATRSVRIAYVRPILQSQDYYKVERIW